MTKLVAWLFVIGGPITEWMNFAQPLRRADREDPRQERLMLVAFGIVTAAYGLAMLRSHVDSWPALIGWPLMGTPPLPEGFGQ